MNKIPTVISIEEDESTFSWLSRIAHANGLKNVKELLNYFVYTYKAHRLQYDLKHLEELHEVLDIIPTEMINTYLKTSTYSFNSLFLTPYQQTNYLNSIFRNQHNNKGIGTQNHTNLIQKLNFCPICRNIEIDEKGYFYFHRSHQLPGVKVCHKHKCTLHQYTGRKDHEFDANETSIELTLRCDISIEYQYASFAKQLLEADLDSNIDEINDIILTELDQRNISLKELLSSLKTSKLSNLLSNKVYQNFKKNKFRLRDGCFESDVCVILMFLYEDVSNIPIKTKNESKNFKKILLDENYELIGPYTDKLIVLKHKECDTTYITNGKSFEQGWRCPTCDLDLDIETIIKRLVSNIDDGSYTMIDKFIGLSTPTQFRHEKCGNITKFTPRELIYEGKRCTCSRNYTYDFIKRRVEIKKDYLLLDFDKNSNVLTVHNTYCNHRFTIAYHDFMENRRCRICHPEPFNTKDQFKKLIAELVGDEYKLIGEFKCINNFKIKLLHTKCNQITEMRATNFIRGHRCKHCFKEIHPDRCKKFIHLASDGKYEFISQSKKRDAMFIKLRNNASGDELELYKPLVLQELSRPTPSPVLPVHGKKSYTSPPAYKKEIVQHYILSNFKKDELISAKDISRELSFDRTIIHRELKNLLSINVVTKVDKGVYQLNI